MEDRDISLKSGTGSTFLKGAYTDYGTKVTLDEDNDYVVISSPQNRPKIRFYVLGTEVTKEVSGESLTVAEGETGETSTGTKITVDKINYEATCTVEGTAEGTSVRVVPVGQLVYSDADTLVAQNHIIVGGYYVNALARDAILEDGSALEDVLTDETSPPVVARTQTGDIIVAGYTAEQTAEAARELIRELESLI